MNFNANEYKDYVIKVNDVDLTDYLADSGYEVEWSDISYDTGRNAAGNMHYNSVNDKYKIILHTSSLTLTQFTSFYRKIAASKTISVEFLDPFTGTYKQISCYRGDRNATMKWNRTDRGILMEPNDISLIEL